MGSVKRCTAINPDGDENDAYTTKVCLNESYAPSLGALDSFGAQTCQRFANKGYCTKYSVEASNCCKETCDAEHRRRQTASAIALVLVLASIAGVMLLVGLVFFAYRRRNSGAESPMEETSSDEAAEEKPEDASAGAETPENPTQVTPLDEAPEKNPENASVSKDTSASAEIDGMDLGSSQVIPASERDEQLSDILYITV